MFTNRDTGGAQSNMAWVGQHPAPAEYFLMLNKIFDKHNLD